MMSSLSVLEDGTLIKLVRRDCWLIVEGVCYDGLHCEAKWLDSYLLVNFY